MMASLILIAFVTLSSAALAGGEVVANGSNGIITASDHIATTVNAKSMPPAKSHTITVEEGVANIMEISSTQPNRLVLPFQDPEFITTSPADVWVSGSALYVIPQGEDKLSGFIQSKDGKHAINVILVPKRIPPQEYRFDLTALDDAAVGFKNQGGNNAHDKKIVETLLEAVRSKKMRGYAQTPGFEAPIYVGPILVRHITSQLRGRVRVDQYEILNKGFERREIVENSFARVGDQGIVFMPPATHLEPQQAVTMWVVRGASK